MQPETNISVSVYQKEVLKRLRNEYLVQTIHSKKNTMHNYAISTKDNHGRKECIDISNRTRKGRKLHQRILLHD
jgi:hypothetical protein